MAGVFSNFKFGQREDFSDLIFQSPDLKVEDRNLAQAILDKNLNKISKAKKKSSELFANIEESRTVKKIDMAIKAILQHKINERGGGFRGP